jgi:hypothetical protein
MKTVESVETYEERRDRERREEIERKEKTTTLILGVLKILKFTPVEKEKDDLSYHVYLDGENGQESIHLYSGGYQMKERIRISGNFPRTERGESVELYRYGEKRHEITVSITKTPEQIARDIQRRFLPRYRELLGGVVERVNKTNQYARTCAQNLLAIKGEPLTETEARERAWRFSGSVFGEVWVGNESARIEIHSLPIEVARKIMTMVKACN